MGHKWVLMVMPKLGRNRSCTGTPRNKKYQGALDRKSRSWTKKYLLPQYQTDPNFSRGPLTLQKTTFCSTIGLLCCTALSNKGWVGKKKTYSLLPVTSPWPPGPGWAGLSWTPGLRRVQSLRGAEGRQESQAAPVHTTVLIQRNAL